MNQRSDSSDTYPSAANGGETGTHRPRTLMDIPGLGPIRVRALQKAGFASLPELRTASLEALLSVPGLTETKAKHIQEYLLPYSPQELEPPEAPDAAMPPTLRKASGVHNTATTISSHLSDSAAQLIHGAARALGEVITLLLSTEAPQFRSRLLRSLGQFAQRAESLTIDAVHLSEEQQERALRRLRRGARALTDFAGQSDSDRKAQGRLAEALDEVNGKLADCILTTQQ